MFARHLMQMCTKGMEQCQASLITLNSTGSTPISFALRISQSINGNSILSPLHVNSSVELRIPSHYSAVSPYREAVG